MRVTTIMIAAHGGYVASAARPGGPVAIAKAVREQPEEGRMARFQERSAEGNFLLAKGCGVG